MGTRPHQRILIARCQRYSSLWITPVSIIRPIPTPPAIQESWMHYTLFCYCA